MKNLQKRQTLRPSINTAGEIWSQSPRILDQSSEHRARHQHKNGENPCRSMEGSTCHGGVQGNRPGDRHEDRSGGCRWHAAKRNYNASRKAMSGQTLKHDAQPGRATQQGAVSHRVAPEPAGLCVPRWSSQASPKSVTIRNFLTVTDFGGSSPSDPRKAALSTGSRSCATPCLPLL